MAVPLNRAAALPLHLRVLLPLLVFSAFLTQLKFLPQIRSNVGLFEILGIAVIAVVLAAAKQIRWEPTILILAIILGFAALSQAWIASTHRLPGLIQVFILLFLVLFQVAMYNLAWQHRVSPRYLLTWVAVSLLVVGPWIIFQSSDSIQAAGPFRNRAHMASYMLTAFWLMLMLAVWPRLQKRIRLISYGGIGFTLYAVAVSGRRSVYLSLAVGLVALGLALFAAGRGRRVRFALAIALVLGLTGLMYSKGAELSPRLAFFRERVSMVGDRVNSALGVGEEQLEAKSFFALQRQGVMMAFVDQPLVGIGWGGFPKSPYSPTGHEVHSTPLRFLAELGLLGLALYLTLQIYIAFLATRLYLRMRTSPYSTVYLVAMIAFWSLNLSYLYNRHVTERMFWLFLAVLLLLRFFAETYQLARAREQTASRQGQPKPPRRRLAPAAVGARSAAARARAARRRRREGISYG